MSSFGPDWIKENERRVKQMHEWYELDKRSDPEHPFHALFTGLNEKYGKKEVSKP